MLARMIDKVLHRLAPAASTDSDRLAAVLLLDPHAAVLAGLERLLEGAWPRLRIIGSVRSAGIAFRLAEAHSPDLIVADVFAAGCDGLNTLQMLLDTGRPVLVLSCRDDPPTRAVVLRTGARDLVSKLAPAGELLAAIDRALKRNPEPGTST